MQVSSGRDFDHETTATFLNGYGVTDADVGVAWEYCGGKPVCLVELINCENKEKAKEMFTFRIGELETRLKLVKELGDEIMIGGKRCDVHYEKLVSTLKMFVSREEIGMNEVDEVSEVSGQREHSLRGPTYGDDEATITA